MSNLCEALQEIQIKEEDLIKRFQPQPNHLNRDAPFDFGDGGCMYETFGEELAFIHRAESDHIWTVIDVDGETVIVSGWYFVNRIGYIICKGPVSDRGFYVVNLD